MLARLASVAVGALLWAGPAIAGGPMSSTSHGSANGVWSIKFVDLGSGKCRVETTKDNEPAWKLEQCVGTAEDHYFISNDGGRFWVIRSFPKVPGGRKYQGRPEKWGAVQVAAEYDKSGALLEGRSLKAFVPWGRDKLRDLGQRFGWLAGVGGLPGKSPRVTDAGLVELDTAVGEKTFRLKF